MESLCAVADVYRDRQVVIKPRFAKITKHVHSPRYLLQDTPRAKSNRSENLVISHDDLIDQFPRAEFCMTIGSTGGLEALLVEIPTYFISDYCRLAA